MSVDVPEVARCLGCGYRLRDLPEAVCPECGRRFDPTDTSTFDDNPLGRRRRRRIILVICGLFLIVVGFALFPRRLLTSTMSFRCPTCGMVTTVTRWEPAPPNWIKWRYPGFHWTSTTAATAMTTCDACPNPSVKVNVQMHMGGSCSGSTGNSSPKIVEVNGQVATPDTAAVILESMMAPSNNGIMIWSTNGVGDDQ